ncbi:hypothetical protein B0H14DRAFT_3575315 [Mycena olivaceomarginata]|nr:hypothetical protein B0H14DRAFT_3575315 [Mycena olivaceomarginata]
MTPYSSHTLLTIYTDPAASVERGGAARCSVTSQVQKPAAKCTAPPALDSIVEPTSTMFAKQAKTQAQTSPVNRSPPLQRHRHTQEPHPCRAHPEFTPTPQWTRSLPRILGWTGDNATVNDTHNTALGTNPNNSFQPENRFPLPDLADVSDRESLADDDEEEVVWDDMDEVEKAEVIEQKKQAKAVISRVRKFSSALFTRQPRHSRACGTKNMAYKDVVNTVTADRNLPLRKYELSDSDWMIVEDMGYTLEASA